MYKLTDAPKNRDLVFMSVDKGCGIARKLTEMGLIPGERLRILNNPGHGPVTLFIKGSKLALGQALADKIMVKEDKR
ncbi:MAG: FeoA domain-containing protein [Patescibacteria group bacterium]|nr:FeoA domain-containing protein [Patescibacteria group bacterium]